MLNTRKASDKYITNLSLIITTLNIRSTVDARTIDYNFDYTKE